MQDSIGGLYLFEETLFAVSRHGYGNGLFIVLRQEWEEEGLKDVHAKIFQH